MNAVVREFLNDWCIVHVGDIQIHSHTPEEHLEQIELVFKKLREYKPYGKLSKCIFMRKELQYLGHVISGEGISVNPSQAKTVEDWATPQDLKQLQRFLGMCVTTTEDL
jgi:hypothetical protein